jgi:hypothetical protein
MRETRKTLATSDIEPAQAATTGNRKQAPKKQFRANAHWMKDFATKSESWRADEKTVAGIPASQPSSQPCSRQPVRRSRLQVRSRCERHRE